MSADPATAQSLRAPVRPSPASGQVSPGPNGSATEAKRPSEFPIRFGLNITPAMAESLERMRRRMRLKEAVIGRLALMHYLAANEED
jgi:hypothetical protein